MATEHNFEVMSSKFNMNRICNLVKFYP